MKLTEQKLLFTLLLTSLCLTTFGQNYERYKKLKDTTLTSQYLGFDKKITITVPSEWQKDENKKFPLIILFDRQNQRSHNYIINTIDYLTSNEQMPSSIIVGIESEQKYRYAETLNKATNKDGLALENENFLFQELIPLMENEFKASPFKLFIGHSRYGYFTSSLFHRRIDQLNGVISLSPFFIQKNYNLADSIGALKSNKLNAHKYYRFGIGNDYPDDYFKIDSVIKNLDHYFINAKGQLFNEADHNVTPGLTIGVALYDIFETWANFQSKYIDNKQEDLTIIKSLKEGIKTHYGTELEFSIGILNGKGWYFYNENQFEKAIDAWEILLNVYPNFSEGYLNIIDAQIQQKKDPSKTIKRFNDSLSKSKIYSENEIKELLNELKSLENSTGN